MEVKTLNVLMDSAIGYVRASKKSLREAYVKDAIYGVTHAIQTLKLVLADLEEREK